MRYGCLRIRTSKTNVVYNSAIGGGSKEQAEEMLHFIEQTKFRPHIGKVFQFDEAVEALEYLARGEHVGKVVIRVL